MGGQRRSYRCRPLRFTLFDYTSGNNLRTLSTSVSPQGEGVGLGFAGFTTSVSVGFGRGGGGGSSSDGVFFGVGVLRAFALRLRPELLFPFEPKSPTTLAGSLFVFADRGVTAVEGAAEG